MNWTHELIGLPWSPQFDCWGLVRRVFKERHGIDMPEHAAGVLRITEAAHVSGWRPVQPPAFPQEHDIVLMRNLRKERHVGVIVRANRRLQVLHNDGCMADGRPTGAVRLQTLAQMMSEGCSGIELWRRA